MAVWQFDVYMVPRKKVLALYGRIPESLSPDDFHTVPWWEVNGLPAEFDGLAGALLPEGRSWADGYRVWGADDGHRIDVHVEDGRTSMVLFRIDLRGLEIGFLERVAGLARRCDGLFVTTEYRIIPADVEALKEEIRHSDALHFVTDPQGFLDGLSS